MIKNIAKMLNILYVITNKNNYMDIEIRNREWYNLIERLEASVSALIEVFWTSERDKKKERSMDSVLVEPIK